MKTMADTSREINEFFRLAPHQREALLAQYPAQQDIDGEHGGSPSLTRHWEMAREESVWLNREAAKAEGARGLLVIEAHGFEGKYTSHWTPLAHLSPPLLLTWGVRAEHIQQVLSDVGAVKTALEFMLLFIEHAPIGPPSYTLFMTEVDRLIDNAVLHAN